MSEFIVYRALNAYTEGRPSSRGRPARARTRRRPSSHDVHARDAPDDDARDARPAMQRERAPLARRRADAARVDRDARARDARRRAAPRRAAAPTDDDDDGGGAARRRRGDGGARARAMRSKKFARANASAGTGEATRAARAGGGEATREQTLVGVSRRRWRWRDAAVTRALGRTRKRAGMGEKWTHRAGGAGDDARARKGGRRERRLREAIGLARGVEDAEDAEDAEEARSEEGEDPRRRGRGRGARDGRAREMEY